MLRIILSFGLGFMVARFFYRKQRKRLKPTERQLKRETEKLKKNLEDWDMSKIFLRKHELR